MEDKRTEARAYTRAEGEDAPEIRDWAWPTRSLAQRPSPKRAGGARRSHE